MTAAVKPSLPICPFGIIWEEFPLLLRALHVDQKACRCPGTDKVVEVFYNSRRVSSHKRDDTPGRHSTHPEHMPESHRHYAEYNPERFINWAKKIGELTEQLVDNIFSSRAHPEHGYRSCLGLMRLESRYGNHKL